MLLSNSAYLFFLVAKIADYLISNYASHCILLGARTYEFQAHRMGFEQHVYLHLI